MTTTERTRDGRTDQSGSQVHCPACMQTEIYRLGDGRYKCKQCKKKFSAKRNKAKISSEKLAALAALFWQMQTAEQCAKQLEINRKTAQNYYDRLRSIMAKENARTLLQLINNPQGLSSTRGNDKLPVFWSLLLQNQIHVIFPATLLFSLEKHDLPEVQGVSEIYTNSPSAKRNVILEKFYRRTLWARKETDEKQLQEFWRQCKINLMKYRGGCKSRFPLFIEEMAFRFNHHEREDVIRLLQNKLCEFNSAT